MPMLEQHTVTGSNGQRYVHRRRPPDVLERFLAALLLGGMIVSVLVMIALGAAAVWLLIVVVQDIARRLGA